jgi:hypothetical protein
MTKDNFSKFVVDINTRISNFVNNNTIADRTAAVLAIGTLNTNQSRDNLHSHTFHIARAFTFFHLPTSYHWTDPYAASPDELIDIYYDENENDKITKFGNYLRVALTTSDTTVLYHASRALGMVVTSLLQLERSYFSRYTIIP